MYLDYDEFLVKYTEAMQTIMELELQIWELCSQNSQLHLVSGVSNSAESTAEQNKPFTRQDRIGQRWGAT